MENNAGTKRRHGLFEIPDDITDDELATLQARVNRLVKCRQELKKERDTIDSLPISPRLRQQITSLVYKEREGVIGKYKECFLKFQINQLITYFVYHDTGATRSALLAFKADSVFWQRRVGPDSFYMLVDEVLQPVVDYGPDRVAFLLGHSTGLTADIWDEVAPTIYPKPGQLALYCICSIIEAVGCQLGSAVTTMQALRQVARSDESGLRELFPTLVN